MRTLHSFVYLGFILFVLLGWRLTSASGQTPGRAELDAAFNQGMALRKQGKDKDAVPFLEKAAALSPKVNGEDHLQTAHILSFLGLAYQGAGRPREAEPCYRRVLEIREVRLGKEHSLVALAWNNLGNLYRELGRYKEAETSFRHCLRICEVALPANDVNVALPLHNFGNLLAAMARYEEAEALHKRSLQILEANKQGNSVAAAQRMNNLGLIYRSQARFTEAETFLRRALEIFQAKEGPESFRVSATVNNLGLICFDLGNYPEAERLYRRSLEIREKTLGKDHPEVAVCLGNLAHLWGIMGRHKESEAFLQRSLKLNEARFGKDSLAAAHDLNNLGGLYLSMGRLESAEAIFRRILAIQEAKLNKDHPAVSTTLNNLGYVYHATSQHEKAEECLKRALQSIEARSGKDSPELLSALSNLGQEYLNRNRLEDANLLFRRHLQITATRLGKDHPAQLFVLHHLSRISWQLGRMDEAEDFLNGCVRISETKFGKTHAHLAVGLGHLARMHQARKQPGKAMSAAERSLQIVQANLNEVFSFSSEAAMLTHLDTISGALPTMLDLAVHADPPDAAAASAYTWTLRLKGTALDTLCRYRQAQHLVAPNDALAQKVARFRSLKQLQASAILTPPQGLKPDQIKEQLASWRTEAEEVDGEINRAFAKKYPVASADGAALTIAAVQARLGSGSALVEFVRGGAMDYEALDWKDRHYRAFVLTPGQAGPKLIDLGPAKAIDDGVRAVRQEFADFQEKLRDAESPEEKRDFEKKQEARFRKVSADLHARLLAPLSKAIGPVKLLYIAADGELNRLPFEALVDADGKYLVESVRCAYLSSGRDLLRKPSKAAKGTVVFAGPDFKADADERLAQADKLLGKTTALAARGSSAPQLRSKGWGPLPGAAAEAMDIHGMLHESPFGPVKTYTGAAALEEVLKAMPAPRVLHLATHGFFLDQAPATPEGEGGAGAGWARGRLKQADNPLLRSGIVLAGANTIGEQDAAAVPVEDGWVTAEEIALLNLQGTELVVLSACQTGLGDIKTGEGVYGLRRAFLYAGARTLVTSLFEVPDTETRELMNRFYGGLKNGQGKLASLHAAQVEMLRGRRAAQGSAHPFFWASFVLVGDPD